VKHIQQGLAALLKEYRAKPLGLVAISSNDVEQFPEASPEGLRQSSRAIGRTWRGLRPPVKKLKERKDMGLAISPEEHGRSLDAAATLRSPVVRTAIPLLMLTGLRSGEAVGHCWSQVNLCDRTITVGRAKTSSGTGRVIPLNVDLASLLASHRARFVERFGEPGRATASFHSAQRSPRHRKSR
jgi:integrase